MIAHWLRGRTLEARAALRPPSVGAAFFACAMMWFAAVASVLPLDGRGVPADNSADAPPNSGAMMPDGSGRLVYWLGESGASDRVGMSALTRFAVVALSPPAALTLAALLLLSLAESRRYFRLKLNR